MEGKRRLDFLFEIQYIVAIPSVVVKTIWVRGVDASQIAEAKVESST